MRKLKIYIFVFTSFVLSVSTAQAKEDAFYKELNLVGGYSNVDGWVARKKMSQNTSAGVEYFRKFSSEYGDYMTLDIQARLAYNPREEFDEAWSIELHNAWLDFKLGLGSSIRIGHFDPAFGLEPVIDTHGTLFQTLARENIGFKKDWGVEYRGMVGDFDYEIAGSLGSGMGIERKDGSYLLTGRIGSHQVQDFQYGLSLLYGDVLQSDDMATFPRPKYGEEAIRKKRIGVDVQYNFGPYLLMGEVAFGQNEKDEVIGFMTEADYTVPFLQALTLKLQWQFWDNDLNNPRAIDSTLGVGASYKLTSDISLRLAYFHDFQAYGREIDRQVYLQFYYYGF